MGQSCSSCSSEKIPYAVIVNYEDMAVATVIPSKIKVPSRNSKEFKIASKYVETWKNNRIGVEVEELITHLQ